jgi:hypothetical protein
VASVNDNHGLAPFSTTVSLASLIEGKSIPARAQRARNLSARPKIPAQEETVSHDF